VLGKNVHRVVVWVILADFDGLFAVVAAIDGYNLVLETFSCLHCTRRRRKLCENIK
jgi:hypothetical protein